MDFTINDSRGDVITFTQNLIVFHSFSSADIFILAYYIIIIKDIVIIYNTI